MLFLNFWQKNLKAFCRNFTSSSKVFFSWFFLCLGAEYKRTVKFTAPQYVHLRTSTPQTPNKSNTKHQPQQLQQNHLKLHDPVRGQVLLYCNQFWIEVVKLLKQEIHKDWFVKNHRNFDFSETREQKFNWNNFSWYKTFPTTVCFFVFGSVLIISCGYIVVRKRNCCQQSYQMRDKQVLSISNR